MTVTREEDNARPKGSSMATAQPIHPLHANGEAFHITCIVCRRRSERVCCVGRAAMWRLLDMAPWFRCAPAIECWQLSSSTAEHSSWRSRLQVDHFFCSLRCSFTFAPNRSGELIPWSCICRHAWQPQSSWPSRASRPRSWTRGSASPWTRVLSGSWRKSTRCALSCPCIIGGGSASE